MIGNEAIIVEKWVQKNRANDCLRSRQTGKYKMKNENKCKEACY